MTLTYRILKDHLISGQLIQGREIGIRMDQTLTQDATGTMAYLQFEAMGIDKVKTEVSVSYIDHNTLQEGFENADDHRYLQSVAAAKGVYFSRPGNGICHQVHLERFGRPGATLIGSDSHTPTGGGIGMIAVGAGGIDVAVAMGGGAFHIVAPKVIGVRLTGRLRKWVSAKDVILKMLSIRGTKGNVNCVVEYFGDGVKTLSVPDRATITNMGAEMGVTTSIFPSDEVTLEFLRAQGRETSWVPMQADKDAVYDETIDIDLSAVVPMAACPHSPGNVVPVSELAGKKVDQAAIGSCTNSSLRDLFVTAEILKDKLVGDNISLIIAPGSRQVFSMMARSGHLAYMIDAGARIMESTCGFCIGNGQAPCTDAVSVRTNNRNFEGRSGTKSGQIYIVSPETAALCAINGVFVDPLTMPEDDYPVFDMPVKFLIDDRMIISPERSRCGATEILRGPNIGEPPVAEPLKDIINGRVLIKAGDRITTDHIMPAGSRLKYRSNIKKYSEFVFEILDPEFYKKALALKQEKRDGIIAAGQSYGQGSSREHAAMCPMYLGVKAVIAKSFERIHAANLINFGILPLVFDVETDYDDIDSCDDLIIEDLYHCLDKKQPFIAKNTTKGTEFALKCDLSDRQRAVLRAGGLLNYTKNM